jgi:hypothetical protein
MGQKIEMAQSNKKSVTIRNTVPTCQAIPPNQVSKMPLTYIKNDKGHFVCPDCGVTKKNQNTMHYHMKKHEEQTSNICKVCKKGFLQKQTLDLHIRSKHPELLENVSNIKTTYKCPFDECEFSALTKGNCIIHCLRVHFQDEISDIMIKNNETKTIICNECDAEFSSSCAFYYHCKGCICQNSDNYTKLNDIVATTS